MLESTLVPDQLRPEYDTVSEALLELSEDTISDLRLNAPLLCNPQKAIVPVEFVLTLTESGLLGIREHVLDKILESDESNRAAKLQGLFPPEGNVAFWDVDERIYRTRYMEQAAFSVPPIPQEVIQRKGLKDFVSYWWAVNKGEIVPFMNSSIDLARPDLEKPWAFEFTYQNNPSKYKLFVAYRGCSQLYDYPFRASAFRCFQSNEEAQSFDRIKKFVSNLIVEFTWSTYRIVLSPNESESIIQHYKVLPWTYMTDVSYDVNIAKAFACSLESHRGNRTPVLYQVALLNVDTYDLGASIITNLPFKRPRLQKALSIIGLNGIMEDPTGVIVSLTEHPFYYDHKGTSWDSFGGSTFTVDGRSFDSLFLKEEEYRQLQSLLCPQEPEEIQTIFVTIIGKVRNSINRFGLSDTSKQAILDRLLGLQKELTIGSKNGS